MVGEMVFLHLARIFVPRYW